MRPSRPAGRRGRDRDQLGVADVIADVVETGTTLRQPGLEIFGEPILRVEAVLDPARGPHETAAVDVLVAGSGRPRGAPLRDDGLRRPARAWSSGLRGDARPGVADRVPAAEQGVGGRARDGPARADQPVMDDLYDLGARAILVTDIAACRL